MQQNDSLWQRLIRKRVQDGGMPFYSRERGYLLRLAATHRRVREPVNHRHDQTRLAFLRSIRP